MWGAIAGAVLGGAGDIVGGIGARDATKDYNDQVQRLNAAYRDWNYNQFLQSRGQGGNALLPLYFPQGTENQLANDALNNYLAMQAASGTPSQEIANYQAATQALLPATQGADTAVNNLFSGRLADQQVANVAPVAAARGAVAQAQKTGILEGLQARLAALSADRARAGYVGGGSTFEKNRLVGATIPALQQAATVGAQADLANATDVANIRNSALNTQLQSTTLPAQTAVSNLQLLTAPQAAQTQAQQNRMNLFNWFKLPVQAFQWNQVPQTQLVPNDLMIAGAALKGAGAGVGSGAFQNAISPGSNISTANQSTMPAGWWGGT